MNKNSPLIKFSNKASKETEAKIVFYKKQNESLDYNKKDKKYFENYEQKLKDSSESVYITNNGKFWLVFIEVKNDNLYGATIKGVKAIADFASSVSVLIHDRKIEQEIFGAKLSFDNKVNWTLKSKEKKLKVCLIEVVVNKIKNDEGLFLAEAMSGVQKMVDMPSNYLTPKKMADIAKSYQNDKLTVNIYDKKYIEEQQMTAFLSVAKGSIEEPKLIVMEYVGNKKSANFDLVLVGKGLTFDSGGISIKPSLGMAAMKGDMAGAATAIEAINYASKKNLPINMVTVVVACENMPDAGALKPGDVIKSMNGKTIEVIDTDAEGRLVLSDALVYAQKYNSKYTIDMATLTGACVVALGSVYSGLFTKDEELSAKIISAGLESEDKVWRMPLEGYDDMLESNIADISNLCIGKGAGAQNGAVFLQEFAPKSGWAHLDIAGSSYNKSSGATSRPMALIAKLLTKI